MITVLGAGAFGTALAVALSQRGPVTLWARDAGHLRQMQSSRENTKRLPGIAFPETLRLASNSDDLPETAIYLLAVPMQKMRAALTDQSDALAGKTLIACCKGMELNTGHLPTQVITDVLPNARAAILTGPSFAADIARGLPTALTLACADDDIGQILQGSLGTKTLRLYRTQDVLGAELGGALKNVMAIACGAVMGAGLGESARAALMTRGFAEMCRLADARGADPATLSGLSGFGDLALTCTSDQSRNYQFGLSLGRQDNFDASITVEGAATAEAVLSEARKSNIEMPITAAVTALSKGKLQVADAMDMLLSRPLKEE